MVDGNELLDAVDALTLPVRRVVLQENPGEPTQPRTVKVEMPPLLTQLEDAIRGSMSLAGSGALASERNLLDGDALHKFITINSLIRDWARLVNAKVTPGDPSATLRAWYVGYTVKPKDEAHDRFYWKQLTAWERQIVAKLDPPRVRELPQECPACGAGEWWDPKSGTKYAHPLVVEYKPSSGPDMVQQAKGLCRSCATVWGVRELAYVLEQKEQEAA